ncbi:MULTISPECIES: carbamoyl phosphate synthase large subunit [Lactobacillus]|uniref:Carbamoyl phosphate synthase large subunit n=1 Tax=Lactobacillus xujianguonis TaxID=2495899 RepID=A0A437SXV5_9LACO|nr:MULTISPECIES: carbamoyl phosphate synthase large subunit [Lactobacillus]RVU71746.1 carbamoyl phosphate synthase large subunit [Lactobacillus xujianguonis]
MPLENDLDKILIIGSGPTLIGSVAEMDLLTTDAISALVEEGIQVVLVNPNPAMISTDRRSGVTVYLEPMTLDFLKRILRMEEPDAIMTAYGSTTGLKVAHKLIQDGILQQMGIKLLTLNPRTLAMGNQQKRIDFFTKLKIDVNKSWQLAKNAQIDLKASLAHLQEDVSFPILVTKYHRYVHNDHQVMRNIEALTTYFQQESKNDSFSWKNYRLTEDLSAWEEVVVNLIRDRDGNIVFLNFADSIEPVGINSGDSAIVMPAFTLNNDQIQELRAIGKKIADSLNVLGILNLHFAVKHHGTHLRIKVLSIKPRLTRSAVWIQKIGLYSIGYIVAKIAIGYTLNEITDPESGLKAAVEPTLDTVSIKMPYWSLAESGYNHYQLGNRMQASGEAMGVGRNFESAFLKGLQSTSDIDFAWKVFNKELAKDVDEILNDLTHPDEMHLIKLLAAIAKGISYPELFAAISLHPIYYQKLQNIIQIGQQVIDSEELTAECLLNAKKYGFSNELIAKLREISLNEVTQKLAENQLQPSYLQLDGSAGVYKPNVQTFYSAYGVQNEVTPLQANKKVLIIGMLPLQVSVTSEFDYMIAHAAETLHNEGYATILLSNNDESVAANYKMIDRVYFDAITVENIVAVAKKEHVKDILLQFSGKKVSALSEKLIENGLHILGREDVDLRERINVLLATSTDEIKRVPSLITTKREKVKQFVDKFGFPILIGGFSKDVKQKSAVVYDIPAIKKYLEENQLEQINISRFIEGNKYEVTAISDGQHVTIPGIIEHLEQTGSHASDSIAVFKPQNLNPEKQKELAQESIKLIKQLNIRGIYNLHFLKVRDTLYLLQIKPYAGHNVAFLSKSVGKDITACATEVIAGRNLADLGYKEELWPSNNFIHVKMPVFSYINYSSDNTFDSKMKSSGSVMGRDTQLAKALYKGYEASDLHIPSYGTIFISVRDEDKARVTQLARRFDRLGFKLVATEGTANMFAESGITTGVVDKVHDNPKNLLDKIRQHKIVMVVNVINLSDAASSDAIRIRDQALYTHIPVFSSIETAELILDVLESLALTTQPI